MKRIFTLWGLIMFTSVFLFGQRYLEPIFDDVSVTANVTYGVNATVLLVSQVNEAVPQQLTCDIFEPEGDAVTSRPLIIMLHTGNFLPPTVNGGCSGTSKDTYMVDIATRLAKMGYVVAIANYRLGWNPVDPMQTMRVYTLINAAYRGVQDSRTAIRFFRKSVQEGGNPYGINPDKIVLWGVGTGGYVSYASATLDTITDTWIPKFTTPQGPMVIEEVNGNVDGTTYGVVFTGYPWPTPGDTLNYPNHVGYSSEFQLGVNMGGSLGDTSWIDADDPPFISFHVPTDPFAPCETSIVNVPPPINLPVVEVSGSCVAQPIFNREGVNACQIAANLTDPISQRARSLNGDIEGFYPFLTDDPTEASPWQYSATLEPYGVAGSNCDTASVVSAAYIDTVLLYFAPRAVACLNLNTSVNEILSPAEVGLVVSPVPATDAVYFETATEFPIEDVAVYDMNGKYITGAFGLQNNSFTVKRGNLTSGIYITKLRFKEGILTHKIVFY